MEENTVGKWGGQKGGVIKGERREEAKTVKRRGEKTEAEGKWKGTGRKASKSPLPGVRKYSRNGKRKKGN